MKFTKIEKHDLAEAFFHMFTQIRLNNVMYLIWSLYSSYLPGLSLPPFKLISTFAYETAIPSPNEDSVLAFRNPLKTYSFSLKNGKNELTPLKEKYLFYNKMDHV